MLSTKPSIICIPALIALLYTTGCGTEVSSSHLAGALIPASPPRIPLLIGAGGNASCKTPSLLAESSPYGMDFYPRISAMRMKIEEIHGVAPNFIATCFDAFGITLVSTWDEVPQGRLSAAEALDYFASKIRLEETSRYMIAGHSYGGWLIMKLLANSQLINVPHRIYTIDPISKENCSILSPWGCTEAPSDFSTTEREIIADNSEEWINFWQDETWLLHSAPIDQASSNLQIYRSHTSIDNNGDVWASISESFIGSLAP